MDNAITASDVSNKKDIKMKMPSVLILILFVICQSVTAQDRTLLTDKQGSFKIVKGVLHVLSADQYGKNCDCKASEAEANLKELEKIVQIFRQCPVLSDNKGFDAIYNLGTGRCSSKFGYPVPSIIAFYLRTWSLNKGKEVQWTIEPPQWRMDVNMTDKYVSNGFNETDFSNAYNPTNPAFSEEGMRKATADVNELFFQPEVKEVIRPGIDRYGEIYVIYNPDRPPYWQQVTVREAYRLLLNYWKSIPDKAQSDVMAQAVNTEFSGFTEKEKDEYAYFGNPESVYRIVSSKNEKPVLRPNPDYWNKNLPRSAIQIMVLEIPNSETVKNKMNNSFRTGDGYYYIYRLLDELDINSLLPVIAH